MADPSDEHRRRLLVFDRPSRVVVGTVGEPGQRTFYLQAAGGGEVVSVQLEKQQAALLADRLTELLAEVRTRFEQELPTVAPESAVDLDPLATPLEPEFRVGGMALGYDGGDGAVVLEAYDAEGQSEDAPDPEPMSDEPGGPDTLRVRVEPVVALAFVERTRRVVAAGRRPCPLCGEPLDPGGHICPRSNGYRRRARD